MRRYAEEVARRQEAEKVAMEFSIQGGGKASGKTGDTVEELRKSVETERQLRKLAENDVHNMTKQLNEKQGRQFDLMTVTGGCLIPPIVFSFSLLLLFALLN